MAMTANQQRKLVSFISAFEFVIKMYANNSFEQARELKKLATNRRRAKRSPKTRNMVSQEELISRTLLLSSTLISQSQPSHTHIALVVLLEVDSAA